MQLHFNTNIPTGATTIVQLPLAFVRSGSVSGVGPSFFTGNMYNVGNEGWYWSSTVEDEEYVYYLDFIISNVVPSDSHVARHNGCYYRMEWHYPDVYLNHMY